MRDLMIAAAGLDQPVGGLYRIKYDDPSNHGFVYFVNVSQMFSFIDLVGKVTPIVKNFEVEEKIPGGWIPYTKYEVANYWRA